MNPRASSIGGASASSTGGSGVSGGTTRGGASSIGGAGGGSAKGGSTSLGGASGGAGGGSAKGGWSSVGGASGGSAKGGSTSLGGAGGGSIAITPGVQSLITNYATPFCSRLAACCAEEGFVVPESATCIQRELGFYGDSLADESALVNLAGATTLLSAIQSTCDQPSYALFGNLTVGTRPVGSDCTEVSQCVGSSVMCQILSGATVGKCVALARGQLGDSCAVHCDNTSTCRWTIMGAGSGVAACWDEDGLRCSEAGVCVALTPIGSSCESGTCGVHADCNGVCRARGKLGESCSDGRSCESTLICDSDSKTCVKMSIAWSGSCSP